MAKRLEMAQDDHNQRSDNGSSGSGSSKSSKKLKPKKVPQRGLGVAQLEKIRLEEQLKKTNVLQSVLQNKSPISAPNFRPNPPSQPGLPSIDSVFKTNPVLPNSSFSNQKPALFSKPLLLNGVQSSEGESYSCDQNGAFDFRPNGNLIYESIPVLAPPNGIPRKELFQQQNSSSMAKVSSSSSVITYNNPIEPPSNQSFYGKIITTSRWPEEDQKMIGMKRPYPFSLENPPGPAFPCKFPPIHVQYPIFPSAESSWSGNGGLVHVETQKPLLKEGSARLNLKPETKTEKVIEQKGELDGDFLTLAPPKSPELSELESESEENAKGPSFYSFLPSSEVLNDQATNTIASCSGEVAEKLDLNLKL